ncbi:hypothetical protein ACEWY4_025374 [Coilia grayii]|uniref:snRNA-activating protein complex subunit 4 n=1 Tax=Coilia grayii TaxID=363190 RepID=A0ABD1IZD4_9TELE
MEYLRDKLSKAKEPEKEMEKEALQKQIEELEVEIAKISGLGEEDLMGTRHDDHDWDKIANIDFEGKRDAEDIKQFWQNYLHPSINKSPWKPEEIEKLKGIVMQHQGYDWEKIADKMETNRTAFMCFQAHQRYIYKNFKRTTWTSLEDRQLRDLVHKKRIGNFIPYIQISYFMSGRDANQVMYRWTQVLDPAIKKGPWSKEEDAMLLKAIEKHGFLWWRVRYEVPGRTDGQCRERYLDCLSEDVKKGSWTPEEEILLRQGVLKYGVGKWTKIASEVPGRTDSQCLQKWRLLTRAYKKKRRRPPDTSSSVVKTPSSSVGKIVKKRPKKPKADDDDPGSDEEVEYLDSDCEGYRDEDNVDPSSAEEEPEVSVPRYVQPPFCEWIPRQTPGVLRMFLVKHPKSKDLVQSTTRNGFIIPHVHYSVLDRSHHVVDRFKAQEYETLKKRTYKDHDDDVILVPQVDIKCLYDILGARIMKTTEKEKRKAAQVHSKPPSCGTKAVGTRGAVTLQKGVTSKSLLCNELMAVVSSWMGNILIPLPSSMNQKLEVDVVRQQAAKVELSSTPVFLAFLKILHIDSTGCKNVISARRVQGLTGTHQSPAQQMMSNKNMGTSNGRKSTSEALKHSRMRQQQALSQPQQLPQSQTGFAQMPQLPLSHSVQIAQPVLMSLIPPQSTCSSTVSSAPEPTRTAKRTRKPTAKAKELMEETKAKNQTGHKRPRLENPPKTVSPVTWIITPPAQIPLNTQTHNGLIVNSMMSLPPAATGLTPPCPPTSTNNTCQSNIPLNTPGVLPSTVVFSLSDIQGRAPVMMIPVVNVPNLVATSMASTSVTTTSTSIQGVTTSLPNATQTSPSNSAQGLTTSVPSTVVTTPSTSPQGLTTSVPSTVVTTPSISIQAGSTSAPSILLAASSNSVQGVTTSVPSTAVTTPSTSVAAGGCPALLSPATPYLTVSPFVSPAAVPGNSLSTVSWPNGPSPAAPVRSNTGCPLPVNGALPLTIAPVCTFTPSGSQSQTALQDTPGFDPNLMFLEDPVTVTEWMSGRSGIVVPPLDQRQPYLPPFVSNVNTLQSLLQAKKSLLEHSVRILPPRPSTYFGQTEEEDVADVRRRVVERFSCNPAYLSLKTRFLSCFTIPAFMATVNPCPDQPSPGDQESE